MKLFKEYGFYIPSFFFIKINENQEVERTLFHEYIHFMQDISTTFGLINISKTVDIIKELNKISRELKTIPLNYTNYISDVFKINKDLFSYYAGDGTDKYIRMDETYKILGITREDGLIEGYENIEEINIEIGKNNGISQTFHFGQIAIMESMAHILECFVFGNNSEKSYPYSSVEMIVEYLYPSLKDKLAISELCEASLMYYNPADVLIESLHIMKVNKFEHKLDNDTYSYILNNMKMIEHDDTKIEILSQFEKEIQRATMQVDDLMTVEPLKSKKLISEFIINAKTFRLNEKAIITHRFKKKNIDFINNIGHPLIINSENIAYTNNIEIFYYSIIYSILSRLDNKSNQCHLYNYCSNDNINSKLVDNNCIDKPWKKVFDNNRCPYATVWNMWDLPQP